MTSHKNMRLQISICCVLLTIGVCVVGEHGETDVPTTRRMIEFDLPPVFPDWLPPLVKHRDSDEFVVNLALIGQMMHFTPTALQSALQRKDTIGQLITFVQTLTQLNEQCTVDLVTFLQTALEAIKTSEHIMDKNISQITSTGPQCSTLMANDTESYTQCVDEHRRHQRKYDWLSNGKCMGMHGFTEYNSVMDSMGKVGAGIMQGNILWTGKQQQCNSLSVPVNRMFPFNSERCAYSE
jgi:type III secretory pathway component EscS